MRNISKIFERGYSLIELMISMALGLVVLSAAVQMYSKAVNVTWVVSQRAELQQDARAAENVLVKDISLANAGLSDTPQYMGIGLATGAAVSPRIGADYTGACHLGSTNSACYLYPVTTPAPGSNTMFGVIPGLGQGPTLNATAGPTDVITVVYEDTDFLLNNYQIRFNDINGHVVVFSVPTSPAPSTVPQAVNNTAVGLKQGDLVLFLNGSSGAVAEVTQPVGAGAGPYIVNFDNLSALGFNQDGATGGNLRNTVILNAGNVGVPLSTSTFKAYRLWVVTYYIDNSTGTPTLMRLVNGRKPVPMAENVVDLRFNYTYYGFDADGNVTSIKTSGAGGLTDTPPSMPSGIRTINIANFTVRSQMRGATGYQSINMHTSISARNLGFLNRYN